MLDTKKNATAKMLGQQKITDFLNTDRELREYRELYLANGEDMDYYVLGLIHGKRIERARKKPGRSQEEQSWNPYNIAPIKFVTINDYTVKICSATLPESINGFTGPIGENSLAVCLNSRKTKEERWETLAHEITHVLRGDVERLQGMSYYSPERKEAEEATEEEQEETKKLLPTWISYEEI